MTLAYINAEREIISQAEQGNDITGFEHQDLSAQWQTSFEPMNAEDYHKSQFDAFGNRRGTVKADLLAKAQEIRKQFNDAIAAEDYLRAEALNQLLRVIKIKYEKL